MRANDFLDTLGVNADFVEGRQTETAVIAALKYLGVRNMRDGSTHSSATISQLCAIHSATGVLNSR